MDSQAGDAEMVATPKGRRWSRANRLSHIIIFKVGRLYDVANSFDPKLKKEFKRW